MKAMRIAPAFENDNIAIAFAVDQNYLPYLQPVIGSMVANRKSGNLDILILHGNQMDGDELLRHFRGEKNLSIRFVDVSSVVAEDIAPFFAQKGYISIACSYRLLLPDLLPAYDKVLWLDADIIINRDIGELFSEDVGDYWLGAVADTMLENGPPPKHWDDGAARRLSMRWAKKYNFEPWEGYFNAGVIVMNLAALRKAGVRKRLIEVATDVDAPYQDQDALNLVCRGHVRYLCKRWNFQSGNDQKGIMPEQDIGIVHFVGSVKPWHSMLLDFAELWWKHVGDDNWRKLVLDCIKSQLKVHEKELQYYELKLRKMKHSVSYKLGRALTKPFRAIFGG